MSFKKNNIKKTSPLLPNLIWLLALCLIFLLWLFLIKNIYIFNFKVDKNNSLKEESLNKEKETEELSNNNSADETINILLTWRWWWNHDAPNLTDTIILASINTENKIISMLSIPRDLYVEYEWDEKNWKINWLYATAKFKNNSEKKWIESLSNKITEITWQKIDNYINIDFDWFKKIIDTIWWIEITIPSHFIDSQYPDWNWWYKTLVFKKWTWIFDGENALKYARSRHSTSDFDRSIRQQQVIWAIKNKLNWSYFLTSPHKIKKLYEVFINHVSTDIKLATIVKLAYKLNSSWDFNIISSNINDSCFYWSDSCAKWWFLYTPSREIFWWMSVLLANWTNIENLNNYKKLHKYTELVFKNPELFKEKYKINIFNSLKVNHLAWILSNDIVKYWFNIPPVKSIWNTKEIYEKSVILYNNIDENSATIKALKKFFKWEFKKTEYPLYSKDDAVIEIIIWKDYLLKNNPFEF